jgi:AraC-like DNA-binding protein
VVVLGELCVSLPPSPDAVARFLQDRHAQGVPIDALGDACRLLSNAHVEEVFTLLENAGIAILHEATAPGAEVLKTLLPAARALRSELGRKPTVAELATRAGLSESATMHGLLYVRVLSR